MYYSVKSSWPMELLLDGQEAACSESQKAGYEGTREGAQRAQKLASIAGRRRSRESTSRDLCISQVLMDVSYANTNALLCQCHV